MKKTLTILTFLLTVSLGYSQNQWSFVSYLPTPNPPINSIAVVQPNIIWVCCDAGGGAARVYRSVNGGTNWTLRAGGLPAVALYGMDALDSLNAFVGTVAGSIYKTTNGGANWNLVLTVAGSFTNGIHMFNANYGIYQGDPTATGQPYQFRVTTNGGNNWNLVPGAPIASSEFGVINAWDWTDSSHVWIGSANTIASSTSAKVYKTTAGFYGTWSNAVVSGVGGASGCYYQAIAFVNNTNGMVGSSGGDIKKTTDGGVTYTAVTVPSGLGSFAVINMSSVKDPNGVIRVSTQGDTARVFRTTNLGTTWIREPLPTEAATGGQVQHIIFVNANLGYGGIGSTGGIGGLVKYGPTSGITGNNGLVPAEFKLEQNYPNPFNPSTTINFSVPKSGIVTMKVYNSLGREVETLVNENMAAGTYQVTFDASKLTSGLYFYRIFANGFADTKKMMLVK